MPAHAPAPRRNSRLPDARAAGECVQDQSRRPTPCQVVPVDLWFSPVPAELERAKTLCAPCASRHSCLHDALTRRETWGVWGGEIIDHGVVIARKRGPGRPRRVDRNRAGGGDGG
jgi:WhiB family redox-sensing transcriptional regulator